MVLLDTTNDNQQQQQQELSLSTALTELAAKPPLAAEMAAAAAAIVTVPDPLQMQVPADDPHNENEWWGKLFRMLEERRRVEMVKDQKKRRYTKSGNSYGARPRHRPVISYALNNQLQSAIAFIQEHEGEFTARQLKQYMKWQRMKIDFDELVKLGLFRIIIRENSFPPYKEQTLAINRDVLQSFKDLSELMKAYEAYLIEKKHRQQRGLPTLDISLVKLLSLMLANKGYNSKLEDWLRIFDDRGKGRDRNIGQLKPKRNKGRHTTTTIIKQKKEEKRQAGSGAIE